MPLKEDIKGKYYCKFHNSFDHSTNVFWVFKNAVQKKINKGALKFLEKKKTVIVDKDSFPLVATVNVSTTDLRSLINENGERIKKIIIYPREKS